MVDYGKVKQAFSSLRKRGYLARCAFMCCQNCAGCALANKVEAMPDEKRSGVRGAVFYTKQDTERGERRGLFITYGPLDTQKCGKVGDAPERIGVAVTQALSEVGLRWQWDGNPDKRIEVLP